MEIIQSLDFLKYKFCTQTRLKLMKKHLTLVFILLLSKFSWSQTSAQSFDCQLKAGYQGISKTEIIAKIAKANLESYRLQDKRITLSFDNGFDIVLLSANELEQKGLIHNASTYQSAYSPSFKMPHFHLNDAGIICAEHPITNAKYSKGNN